MSEKKDSKSSVDNTFRRQWDKDEFEKKAKERLKSDISGKKSAAHDDSYVPVHLRESLKTREYKVNLTTNLGKSQIVQLNDEKSKQPGYYCKVCDCVLKDSSTYLDHINGRKHQARLGMTMKVERSSLSDVKGKLSSLKRKRTGDDKAKNPTSLQEIPFTDQTSALKIQRTMNNDRNEKPGAHAGESPSKQESRHADDESDDEESAALAALGLPTGFASKR